MPCGFSFCFFLVRIRQKKFHFFSFFLFSGSSRILQQRSYFQSCILTLATITSLASKPKQRVCAQFFHLHNDQAQWLADLSTARKGERQRGLFFFNAKYFKNKAGLKAKACEVKISLQVGEKYHRTIISAETEGSQARERTRIL